MYTVGVLVLGLAMYRVALHGTSPYGEYMGRASVLGYVVSSLMLLSMVQYSDTM